MGFDLFLDLRVSFMYVVSVIPMLVVFVWCDFACIFTWFVVLGLIGCCVSVLCVLI